MTGMSQSTSIQGVLLSAGLAFLMFLQTEATEQAPLLDVLCCALVLWLAWEVA